MYVFNRSGLWMAHYTRLPVECVGLYGSGKPLAGGDSVRQIGSVLFQRPRGVLRQNARPSARALQPRTSCEKHRYGQFRRLDGGLINYAIALNITHSPSLIKAVIALTNPKIN